MAAKNNNIQKSTIHGPVSALHYIEHKILLVRTLYKHISIVREEDRQEEKKTHIRHILAHCQYLTWAINEGKQEKNNENGKLKYRTKTTAIPYIRGITEPIKRITTKHKINTAVKPYIKTGLPLVHPKDSIE